MDNQLRLRRKQSLSTVNLFCLIATLFCIIIFLCFFISHGELIDDYYFLDARDTGMDFFHSIEYVRGRMPYGQYNTLYPPLANLFFLMIYRMVPIGVSVQWADTFAGGVYARGTDIDLRTYQAPMLCFMVVLIISVWLLMSLITALMAEQPRGRIYWTTFCMLLSPGMMYAFERGNIMFLIVPLILYFVKNRNSENPVVRELALICLAVAAGMKLYPAFFGILLIRDKRYKEAVRAVLYGIASILLPILVFDQGLKSLETWINIVVDFGSDSKSVQWQGYNASKFLHLCAWDFKRRSGIEMNTSWFTSVDYVATFALLVSALLSKKQWQSILAIVMAMLMFKSQGFYSYSLFCIPMIFFLVEEPRITRKNIIAFVLMLVVTVNLPIFTSGTLRDYSIRQVLNLLLTFWCVAAPLIDRRINYGKLEK